MTAALATLVIVAAGVWSLAVVVGVVFLFMGFFMRDEVSETPGESEGIAENAPAPQL